MRTNYVFIDFENVQPKNLQILQGHEFKVYVFVGAKQTKIPFEIAAVMQEFGENAKYIKIAGNGLNALDFHISFYIGQICAAEPDAFFHIISKDTGFDPLIEHLKSRKIKAFRESDLHEIPLLKIANSKTEKEKQDAIIKHLQGRGNSKPRTMKTLSNTVRSLFQNSLKDTELNTLIQSLIKDKKVIDNGGKVTYKLS